jgi:hypothetical protein
MDAVPVCDGQRGTGHLKRFFLFLLVDAQELLKRSVPINGMSRCFGPERLLPMKNRSTSSRKFRCGPARVEMTIGIDLGDVWSHY